MMEKWCDVKACIKYEKKLYSEYMFPGHLRFWLSRLKREPVRMVLSFLILSRKTDYYYARSRGGKLASAFYGLPYLFFVSIKNRLGEKLGLEIGTENIGKGLLIYHYGVVIHGGCVVGENCHLHGNNCIGNNGKTNECPVIGDNVSLGVGAKVIGPVKVANGIKIGAGAAVVHSFLEEGITVVGVPARRVN